MKQFKNPTTIKVSYSNPLNEIVSTKRINPNNFEITEDNISKLFGVETKHFSLNEMCYGLSDTNICILSSEPPTKL